MIAFVGIATGALIAGYAKAWRAALVFAAVLLVLFGGGMAYDYVTIVRPCDTAPDSMPSGACIDSQAQMGLALVVAALAPRPWPWASPLARRGVWL